LDWSPLIFPFLSSHELDTVREYRGETRAARTLRNNGRLGWWEGLRWRKWTVEEGVASVLNVVDDADTDADEVVQKLEKVDAGYRLE
jgi:hypothetical protein